MNSANQNYELAKIAFEGENYQEAYQKYTKVLEEDFNNVDAWLGKALSGAFSSELKTIKFKETQTCISKASEIGFDNINKSEIADSLLNASKSFIKKINSAVAEVLMHKANKPMATGQLYAVKKVGDIADRYETFNKHWEYYEKVLEFMNYVTTFDPSLETLKKKLAVVDFIYSETEGHFNKDLLTKLENYRNNIIDKIKQIDNSFSPTPTPKKPDGCFIATAIYGSYYHENVLVLREYRDKILKSNKLGLIFIDIYYRISPFLAKQLENKTIINRIFRLFVLDKIVKSIINNRKCV